MKGDGGRGEDVGTAEERIDFSIEGETVFRKDGCIR